MLQQHPRAILEIFLSVCLCGWLEWQDIDRQARAEDTARNFADGSPRYYI